MTSKTPPIFIVFAIILMIPLLNGCSAEQTGFVNSNNLPGQTFNKYKQTTKPKVSQIIYLGEEPKYDSRFGPRDVSFELQNLPVN